MITETTEPMLAREDDDPYGLVGATLDGKYDVQRVVAEGGFGVVYQAVHKALETTVAIKVLKRPEDLTERMRAEFLETFVREAKLVSRLDHPAVVRVLDFGASPMPRGDSAAWMVMEWVPGETLDDELERKGTAGARPPAEVLRLLRPVFEALAVAHEEGIAHRDLKPGNLMFGADRRGAVTTRLLDFGVAKVMHPDDAAVPTGQTETRSKLLAFSPRYAAPEQVGGTRTGPWTDVHALALVCTELLTGRPPFDAEDTTELYAQILAAKRPTPRRRGYDVGAWEPVLSKALALKASERHPDAGALLRALEEALPGARWESLGDEAVAALARAEEDTTVPKRPSAVAAQAEAAKTGERFSRRAAVVLLLSVVVGAGVVAAVRAGSRRPAAIPAPIAPPTTVVTPPPPRSPDVAAPQGGLTPAPVTPLDEAAEAARVGDPVSAINPRPRERPRPRVAERADAGRTTPVNPAIEVQRGTNAMPF